MQGTGEMRVHADLCRQSSTHYYAVERSVPYRIKSVGDNGVDMGCLRKETVHSHHAGGRLMVLVANERGLLELHRNSLDVLARV